MPACATPARSHWPKSYGQGFKADMARRARARGTRGARGGVGPFCLSCKEGTGPLGRSAGRAGAGARARPSPSGVFRCGRNPQCADAVTCYGVWRHLCKVLSKQGCYGGESLRRRPMQAAYIGASAGGRAFQSLPIRALRGTGAHPAERPCRVAQRWVSSPQVYPSACLASTDSYLASANTPGHRSARRPRFVPNRAIARQVPNPPTQTLPPWNQA